MTITSQQAHEMRPALQALCQVKGLPFPVVWDIAKKMAVIGVRASLVERMKLVAYTKYGTTGQDGRVSLTPEQLAQAETEFLPIMAETIEVPGDPIPVSQLAKLDLVGDNLTPLVAIINEDVSPAELGTLAKRAQ